MSEEIQKLSTSIDDLKSLLKAGFENIGGRLTVIEITQAQLIDTSKIQSSEIKALTADIDDLKGAVKGWSRPQ